MRAWCEMQDIQLTLVATGWRWMNYPWLETSLKQKGIFSVTCRTTVHLW